MPNFIFDFDYSIREGSTITIPANDKEQAEGFFEEYINETYPDVEDVEIINIEEV